MGMDEKLSKLAESNLIHKSASFNNYKYQSRKRLQRIIETKINTTMIGAISAMEAKFGKLWGQGKPAGQLTATELEYLQLKDELRTEILNNGNNQKRAAINEINQYDVEWKRHHVELQINENNER